MTTVGEIMQADVIGVRRGTSVRELSQILDEEEISGVPVLDSSGGVLGVVSRTDVVRLASQAAEGEGGESPAPDPLHEEPEGSPTDGDPDDPDAFFLTSDAWSASFPTSGVLEGHPMEETPVEQIMTPAAFSVPPEMPVPELARFLLSERIHRALVVDEGRLVGIVTSFDVLRTVADDAGG